MLFNSVTFILYLFVFIILYWGLPRRPRLLLIFIGSLTFYGFWRIEYIPVMMVSVFVDYYAALGIGRAKTRFHRKLFVILSLIVNLGLLFYFKYTTFFAENYNGFTSLMGINSQVPVPNILLPLGISFYTFQSISYTIDVYRGFIKPQKRFLLFANYVIFFPQLIAGPILRAGEVIWQLDRRPLFSTYNIAEGLKRILAGLFLKVVLADNIADLVDAGFSLRPETLGAFDVWTLAFLFGFQIYFDFSAYSHIAIGSARLMGIVFPENFNFPYIATSPRDFWRRWHISLSSWIRDYLYLPLCGVAVRDKSTGGLAVATEQQAVSPMRKRAAIFATWFIMGLWHGAAWTFVLWGIWHAALIFFYRILSPLFQMPSKIRTFIGWALTLALSMLGWIPFRAASLSDTLTMWTHVIDPYSYYRPDVVERGYMLAAFPRSLDPNTYLVTAMILVLVLAAAAARKYVLPLFESNKRIGFVSETAGYALMTASVFIFLRPIRQFIYFQF